MNGKAKKEAKKKDWAWGAVERDMCLLIVRN